MKIKCTGGLDDILKVFSAIVNVNVNREFLAWLKHLKLLQSPGKQYRNLH